MAGAATSSTRIVFLMDSFKRATAGTEKQLLHLIDGLDRTRFTPELVLLRDSEFAATLASRLPVQVLDVTSMKQPGAWLRLWRWSRRLARERRAVVHIVFNDAAVIGPLFAKLGGAAVVGWRRDMGYWYTPGLLRALRFVNRFVDVIVGNSDAVRQNVIAKERVRPERTDVIPNGYDLRAELPPAPNRDVPVIGIVARLRAVKRHADLIRAFAAVVARFPAARLHIIGDGPLRGELEALSASLGLNRAVEFRGETDHVEPEIERLSVGVLCSESEGFSNALIEYLASGVPAVVTAVGGNPEVIVDGDNGYLVPVGDVDALAAALIATLERQAAGDDMRRAAFESSRRFEMSTMIQAYESLYARLAG